MMKKYKLLIISLYVMIGVPFTVQGQMTKVRGKVIDAETLEALPFVNLAFQEKNIGTITDFEGNFYLETRVPVDTLVVSFVGYSIQKIPVQKNVFQTIDITLRPSNIQLQEVVVKAGENPAHRIIRNTIKNRDQNNPDKLESYKYEIYNKMEFDVTNVDDEFKDKRMFKQFQFIFDYVDTSAITGKSYLPVFLTETLSDYYFNKDPKRQKEVIKASNVSGVKNESITQFTGKMYQNPNVYENFIGIFGKQFISPIAGFGLMTYKYYLTDSSFIDNQWCYHISFKPKRKQELTFTGDMWIHDTTFAVKKAKVRIVEDANINYVNDLVFEVEYKQVDNKTWFTTREDLFVDFYLTETSTGLFGRKIASYKNIVIEPELKTGFFNDKVPEETLVLENSQNSDTMFWNHARHEKLTNKEESIYAMVDSIKDVPVFNTFVDIVTMLVGGYYVFDKFEYGPYFKTFSWNPIEGYRFRVGGRTSNNFSTNVMYSGHVAYGTQDEKFKYGLGVMYMFNKSPRQSAGFYHKNDIEQLGQSPNAFTEDNILASLLSRNPNNNLLMVNEFRGFYEKEWFQGVMNKLEISHRQISPSEIIPFEIPEGDNLNSLTSTEVKLNTRIAYNEKFIMGEFERVSVGSQYPIVNIHFTAGLKGVFNSDYEYYKLHFNLSHHLNLSPLGYFKYQAEAGRIWGQVPFPLLRLHEGNETYAFDEYSYNMMNYYEFASDKYASLFVEHHFEGFFLNKIPLLRKLQWREVVYGKGLIGSLDDKNNSVIMNFPKSLMSVNKPYFETGVGIENIFKVLRIDAIWRLSYLDHPNIEKFGIRAKVQVIF